jgi:hypothetical protein
MEGMGFNATLLRDGKKVALVIDDACGGEFQYEFVSAKEEKAFQDFVQAQPGYEFEGKKFTATDDTVISKMLDDLMAKRDQARFDRQMKKKMETNTLFCLKGDDKDGYRWVKAPYSPKVVDYLRKKYGEKIEKIFNEEA